MRRLICLILVAGLLTGCGVKPVTEDITTTPVFRTSFPAEGNDVIKIEPAEEKIESWRTAFINFLNEPENYAEEDKHYAGSFALADLNNDGIPELVLLYLDGVQGSYIFANVYSYDGNVNLIGYRADMFYSHIFQSNNPQFPGVFVEGGRASHFNCYYWTINNDEFESELLWHHYNIDDGPMDYEYLSDNEQLINEAKETVYTKTRIEFYTINHINIQMIETLNIEPA